MTEAKASPEQVVIGGNWSLLIVPVTYMVILGVFSLCLNQSLIDVVFSYLAAIHFDVLLLKTQHLSFVFSYLREAGNLERWHRIVVHYAFAVPIYLWIPYRIVQFVQFVRLKVNCQSTPQKTSFFGKTLFLIFVPAIIFVVSCVFSGAFLDLFYISYDAQHGVFTHHVGGMSFFLNLIYQNQIHVSDWGFFHFSGIIVLQICFLVFFAIALGFLPAIVPVIVSQIWADILAGDFSVKCPTFSQKQKNVIYLLVSFVSIVVLFAKLHPKECFIRDGSFYYAFGGFGMVLFFIVAVLTFCKERDKTSMLIPNIIINFLLCTSLSGNIFGTFVEPCVRSIKP